jgi:hypothetical protein
MRLASSSVLALLASTAALLAFVAAVEACAPDPALDSECARAAHRFSECGATLPALEGATCSATQKAIATCINMNASSCEALAALYQRIDVCVAGLLDNDGGLSDEEIEEIPNIPSKPKDAGADAKKPVVTPPPPSSSSLDASTVEDASVSIDASIPVDAGGGPTTWAGFTVEGTIASGVSRQWVTPLLDPGAYQFALSGTGDADLYVRIGAAATTTLFDCRPFLNGSTESCTITLTSSSKVYLMLRGIATSSTFTLEGSP